MELLLIEDNEHKSLRIQEFLNNALKNTKVTTASSVQAGLQKIRASAPDLILLDMSLPAFTYTNNDNGFQHSSYAGKDILEYLDSFEINIPVIVITAFTTFGEQKNALTLEELDSVFVKDYPEYYIGSVWYSSLEDGWKSKLLTLINSTQRENN
ncbi:response regulator receiver protein [Hymenobacter roseosalivarius DSM 11622]|uniref:Response regulator receiver protein n=1 Tax=Hymenobacter roseosalivarius DSM 11622 TaxID=645990 RepID=A0A1W1UEU8_9BACT|nr:response regulator [Hymenobacter roseosalivarius]SMB79553.1 response regulator receiver protein [Hymenobacter roseosalivarius DSM 11622]